MSRKIGCEEKDDEDIIESIHAGKQSETGSYSRREVCFVFSNMFRSKTALVTGGAGIIGAQIVRMLYQNGANVVFCDRNGEAGNLLLTSLNDSEDRLLFIPCDVCVSDEARRVTDEALARFGRLDFLITVAGGSTREKGCYFYRQSEEVYTQNIQLNLFHALYFAHAASGIMAKQRFGKMVFIASVLGTQGMRNNAEYSAAKAGLIAFAKTLAMEMGEFGININCVSPGLVPHPTGPVSADASDTNYLYRNCKPQEIAGAVKYLLSDDASFVTGVNLTVDGGWGLGVQAGLHSIDRK